MGWIRLNLFSEPDGVSVQEGKVASTTAEYIEGIVIADETYPRQPLSTPTRELPFIDTEVVTSTKKDASRLWVVVDNVVHDCSDFVHEHPGGQTVIESFRGEDCSWQFWRFHNAKHMRESGKPLRVGRTDGVKNRFPERPKFVGLRRPGQMDEW